MSGSAESSEKFANLIKRWITVEENAISSTKELLGETDNPVLKTFIDLMKRDSEKHKDILEVIQQHLTTSYTFTTDDMSVINSFITKHDKIEKNAVELAEETVAACKLPLPKMLLKYLLDDEKKHDLLIDELNKVKVDMATQ